MERTPSNRTSLRKELTTLVAALAIPLLILQGWWSYHDYRGAREQAEMDALAFADATALGVRQFFTQAEELLMASAAEVGEGWTGSEDQCLAHMQPMMNMLPFAANMMAVDGEGRVICSVKAGPPESSAADWAWFSNVRADPKFTVGGPVFGNFTGAWVLPLVAPSLGEDGSFQGAIAASVELTELSRLFGGLTLPETHLVTVATADRIVIARSQNPEERVGQPLPPNTGSDREVAPGRRVASGPDLAGVQRTWGEIEVEPGWIIYVGVPDESVYGPARAEAFSHVGLTVMIVLAGFLMAMVSHRRIAGALSELASRTRAIAAGEIVPVPLGAPSEITEVVHTFNQTLRSRDRAETAERRARERFQAIFDNAVFGLFVSTVDGRFLQVNPAIVRMLRYESEEALMDAGPEALYADPSRRADLVRESLASGSVGLTELEWIRADGVPITVRVAGKVIGGPDGQPVFEMIVQDITDEKRTEDELRQTQKMEAVGQLAGGIAHDFNNLLTVIGGNVELLEDDLPDDATTRADLNQISRATKRATSLTRRLLSFSRKEQRGEEVLDINETIPELAKMLVRLIGENVTLITELGRGPFPVSIDPGELEQVLLNLVLNARDAMPRGGQIVIATEAAPGEAHQADGWQPEAEHPGVSLTVSDSGIGMDEATRRRIFEPFYTTKPMGEGTGLGLSTVYGIVKRAGGRITVESHPDEGTRMTAWLPLCVEAITVAETGDQHQEEIHGSESVLVVEDDELVGRFVKRALEESGFHVYLAQSGDEALKILEARVQEVHLVLTDVVMRGLSGPELADRVAVITDDTPVVFMSGYFDNAFLGAELDQHPESLLRKPFTAGELRRAVRQALDRNASRQPLDLDASRQPLG